MILFGLGLFLTRFLEYSEEPIIADAVVLFVGPAYEQAAREQEAYKLIADGYADYLIIPARGKAFRVYKSGNALAKQASIVETIPLCDRKTYHRLFRKGEASLVPVHTSYVSPLTWKEKNQAFENTHKEILIARKIINELNLKSVILVSSPYHMRRIRIIVKSVFEDGAKDNKVNLSFVSTRYKNAPASLLKIIQRKIKNVTLEYVKIFWFLLSENFLFDQTS